MTYRTIRGARGFSLVELLVVILIISVLLTMAASTMRGIGGKGVSSAIASAEALFDEARSIAVGKGTRARVLVDVNAPRDDQNYKRRVMVVYQELDDQGSPTDVWTRTSRPLMLPDGVFFSEGFSKKDHERGGAAPEVFNLVVNNANVDGKYVYYEFNSEGICTTPGASFVVGSGVRPQNEEPRVTGSAKRDFSGFVVWRNGRTSLFRGPDEIGVPSHVTTF